MATQEFITHSAEETVSLGRTLAGMLAPPKLVLLRGVPMTSAVFEMFHAFSRSF